MYETTGTVVRPSAAVLWITSLRLAVPAALLTITPVVLDPGRMWIATVILLLVLAPLLVGVVAPLRTRRLSGRGTDLVYTDWRGHELVVPAAGLAWASFALVTRRVDKSTVDRRLVMTRCSGAPPLVIDVNLWNQDRICGLLAGLGVQVEHYVPTLALRQLRDMLPGYRPPFPHRHPLLASLVLGHVISMGMSMIALVTVAVVITSTTG